MDGWRRDSKPLIIVFERLSVFRRQTAETDSSTPLWPQEISSTSQKIFGQTNKEISIKSTQQQFWHVFSPHSGLLRSLCLICAHLHHPVSQKRWIILRFQLLRISAGASGRACVQLFLCSFSSHRTGGLISPGPLCFICRPHGVRRPDWLWHRRSKS